MYIRRAKTTDKPDINRLLLQVHKVHSDGRPDIFIPGGQKYTDPELDVIIKNDETPVFIAEDDDGNVLGYCFCMYQHTEKTTNMYERKTLYIDDLCVYEDKRNSHIGKALYDYVVSEAEKNGCDSVTLNVWSFNDTARVFYDNRGMKPLKTTMEQILKK